MGNISSVGHVTSKVNLEEMEIPHPPEAPSNTNISSGILEFVDYTYSKNSEKAIEDIPKERSFKFSFNSGSNVEIEGLRPFSSIN